MRSPLGGQSPPSSPAKSAASCPLASIAGGPSPHEGPLLSLLRLPASYFSGDTLSLHGEVSLNYDLNFVSGTGSLARFNLVVRGAPQQKIERLAPVEQPLGHNEAAPLGRRRVVIPSAG